MNWAGLLSVLVICATSGLFDMCINDLERERRSEYLLVRVFQGVEMKADC